MTKKKKTRVKRFVDYPSCYRPRGSRVSKVFVKKFGFSTKYSSHIVPIRVESVIGESVCIGNVWAPPKCWRPSI